MKENFISLI